MRKSLLSALVLAIAGGLVLVVYWGQAVGVTAILDPGGHCVVDGVPPFVDLYDPVGDTVYQVTTGCSVDSAAPTPLEGLTAKTSRWAAGA